jgi:hypothetical protein
MRKYILFQDSKAVAKWVPAFGLSYYSIVLLAIFWWLGSFSVENSKL